MNELITIDIRDGEPTVNARDLHKALGVGKDFSNWIKGRIESCGFIEDVDYTVVKNPATEKQGEFDSPNLANQNKRGGDRRSIEYYLSIDMGKEVAMLEYNEIGRKVRRYFIEAEKQLREGKTSYAKIRGKSKATRIKFTDTLKEHGYKARHEYIQTTMQMKEAVGITAAKGEMDADELIVIEAAESIARLNIKRAGVIGYKAVNPVAVKSAKAINRAVQKQIMA